MVLPLTVGVREVALWHKPMRADFVSPEGRGPSGTDQPGQLPPRPTSWALDWPPPPTSTHLQTAEVCEDTGAEQWPQDFHDSGQQQDEYLREDLVKI